MKCTKCGYWSSALCECGNQFPILKEFNNGEILISNDKGESAIVSSTQYDKMVIQSLDLRKLILERLNQAFPHLSFLMKNKNGRDSLFVGGEEIYPIATESFEFWMNGKALDDIRLWMDGNLFPPIFKDIIEAEHLRCCKSFDYFNRYYASRVVETKI